MSMHHLVVGAVTLLVCLALPLPGTALTKDEVRQRSLKRLERVSEDVKTLPPGEDPSGVSLGRSFPAAGHAPTEPAAPPPPRLSHTGQQGRAAERKTDEAVIIPVASEVHGGTSRTAPIAHFAPNAPAAPATPQQQIDPAQRVQAMELFRQALAASKKNNHKKALELLDKAAALNPTDPDIFNNRGNAYNNLGDQQKALADYNTAVSLRPGDAAALSNRGLAHERMGDDAAACRDYRAACDLGDCNFFESFKKEGRCSK
ncbi:tetratricopeptide repeat protein [Desulfolutivibrio sp.]|uniref:tetratricopeptide repeat protein n=1 Tax=Desulfolutivibrio sp. TaxID=2773296 RepID=UPI002F967E2C